MANAVRKLFYYGIVEHLQLLLRLFNVILLFLFKKGSHKKQRMMTAKTKTNEAANTSTSSSTTTTTRSRDTIGPPAHTHRLHRVTIVGASFAGCKVEQLLSEYPDHFDITWIDEKSYFEYIPGSLRCLIEPDHFHHISCSLTDDVVVVANNAEVNAEIEIETGHTTTRFLQGRVVDIPTTKTLRLLADDDGGGGGGGGDVVSFDSLVLCAGSTYACCPIIKTSTITTALDRVASYHTQARQIRASQTIIIVGAGAVGVELAGELLMLRQKQGHLRRARKIILIDMATTILSGFPAATVQYATEYLVRRNVQLLLQAKIQEMGEKQVVLADGTVLAADLVYKCMGAAPNTQFLQSPTCILKDALTGPKQALSVNDQLQVPGYPHIYAAGDMMHHANSNEVKLGHTAEVNGIFIAESLIAKIVHPSTLTTIPPPNADTTTTTQRTYPHSVVGHSATPFIYCISLGKYDGTLGFNGLVVNGFIAAIVKWMIEWTKVAAVRKQPIGILFWQVGDTISNWLGRTLLLPTTAKDKKD